ncbi:hypothetical protein GPECTOR_30g141 [Gonium pectorale]|uniref:6-phosphofructo-2-kinase domain-containing protein n=1 Tax=Gonium pectorale TaxID=33097 RepID=A0A150GDY7_GONPE|nr:hypothetical protein GPECTOR_30g141 [Gonium pectorale]|eukprot:KXZ48046.1 hypothetical protein GPECTOR_30g141 [Gonium pectorale]
MASSALLYWGGFGTACAYDKASLRGVEARSRALNAALDDLMDWLRSDLGQVAVFDATNTTQARRELLRSKFHNVWQYLFIETICSDPTVLENNYRNKMQYSPDYTGVNVDKAVSDFLARIAKYEEVYEPISDRTMHYIKLIDMVTGRGHMDINRISGYIPGKIVFFLMQVCKAGLSSARKILLTRHGESEYNQRGLIGGNSSLSERGERYARLLPEAVIARLPEEQQLSVAVWTSTLKRTIETARFLPFPKLRWKALDEINAGICDGLTYEQIGERFPEEYAARKNDKLRYRYPAGESYMDVIQRVEPVIIELEREREYVVVVAHQAVLRAVYAYFMGVAPEDIPRLAMPLHTLIELTPMPDGTMHEERFPVDIDVDMSSDYAGPAVTAAPAIALQQQVQAAATGAPPQGLAHSGSGLSDMDTRVDAAPGGRAGGCGAAGGGHSPRSSITSELEIEGAAEAAGLALPASPAGHGAEMDAARPPEPTVA